MKFTINKVTARPFLVPRPGSGDDPLFTVIGHIYHTSLKDFLAQTRQLPRPGLFSRLFRPADQLGVFVTVTHPSGRTLDALCRFKKGQFPNVLDLIFPRGTAAGDVVDGSTVEAMRFDWVA